MKPNSFFLGLLFIFSSSLFAQKSDLELKSKNTILPYDEDLLPAEFHRKRREALRQLLPDSTAAVFFSAPERKRSNDVYYEYHQDPNFYYLTGLREPNALLIVFKDSVMFDSIQTNEMLYLQERDPEAEIWNGRRLGIEGGIEQLGLNSIQPNRNFKNLDPEFQRFKRVYFISPEAMEPTDSMETDQLFGLYHQFKNKLDSSSAVAEKHLEFMMAQLRQNKTEEELTLLRKAIAITCEAQNELMKQINQEMTEYQSEAIIEYVFKRNGAEYPGFPSIQGSGENSCILHYTTNRRPFSSGGLLVSDVGAEYHGYTADVTRTIPPSGKFSKEEAIIYNLVLEAQQAGIEAARAGNSFWAPHLAAQNVIRKGLLKLGIIEQAMEVSRYFMHGTSHYLGLDVHDAGLYQELEENQVITVEPGIYISEGSDCDPKWWNIGVRIEDDILIRPNSPENLSDCSPRTLKEVEKMMGQGK